GTLTDYDVFKLVSGDQATGSADRISELLILRSRRTADPPRRRLDVLLVDGSDHIRRVEPELAQFVRIHPDSHAVVRATEQIHLGNAGNAEQLVAQVDAAIVDEKVGIVRVFGRVERNQHQDAGTLLFYRDSLLRNRGRQASLSRRDPVLGEHVGSVLIHP